MSGWRLARVRPTCLVGAFVGALVASMPALADEGVPEVRQLYNQGEIRSLAAMVERARERHPEARLVEAELLRDGERLIYEVELIDADGVVRELFFDARSGDPVTDFVEEGESH